MSEAGTSKSKKSTNCMSSSLPSQAPHLRLPNRPANQPRIVIKPENEDYFSKWLFKMRTKLECRDFFIDQKNKYHLCGGCPGIFCSMNELIEHVKEEYDFTLISKEKVDEFLKWEEEQIIARKEAQRLADLEDVVKEGRENLTASEHAMINNYAKIPRVKKEDLIKKVV